MKTLLCIVVLALLGRWAYHGVNHHREWQRWDRARAEADRALVSETKGYEYSAKYQVLDCPSRRPLTRDDLLVRVGNARMRAIQVMRQKPGTLTSAEERRLQDYSAWFSRLGK